MIYEIEKVKPKYAELEDNPVIVETAGFIPLEVKFKMFEQNGVKARFQSSEFTSSDYRDMYLGPNTEILPTDDIEEVEYKLALQEEVRLNILKSKLGDSVDKRSEEKESPSPLVEKEEVKTGEELVK